VVVAHTSAQSRAAPGERDRALSAGQVGILVRSRRAWCRCRRGPWTTGGARAAAARAPRRRRAVVAVVIAMLSRKSSCVAGGRGWFLRGGVFGGDDVWKITLTEARRSAGFEVCRTSAVVRDLDVENGADLGKRGLDGAVLSDQGHDSPRRISRSTRSTEVCLVRIGEADFLQHGSGRISGCLLPADAPGGPEGDESFDSARNGADSIQSPRPLRKSW